ncbi:MAG TPA: MFS transporter [Rhodospirillales bacterium]|nr:MFS transporter [Rhodospirillales bacterium]
MKEIRVKPWAQTLAVYRENRMAKIFLFGVISGFPWVLIGTCLSLWLKENGLSRSTIGWAGLIFGVYALNFLWAPLIDKLKIPYFTKTFGHRKSWVLLCQIIIFLGLFSWSFITPTENLFFIIVVGLFIAISSATQDIAIDAFRIEQAKRSEEAAMAAGAAMAVIGWWTGFKVGGILSLYSAELFQRAGFENYWQLTFLLLSLIIIICSSCLIMIDEPIKSESKTINVDANSHLIWLSECILDPILSFFKKNGWGLALALISFIFLFKIGEAFMGRMSIIFYKEIGFSKTDIALYSKGVGWITTIAFTLIGGVFTIKAGIFKALVLSGIAMATTNLFFSLMAWVERSELLFVFAVLLDDLATAFATVTFVAFISILIDRNYTATQYALLASVGTAGRTLLASSSGAMVDWLNGDWALFFILTTMMVIPSLILLFLIKNRLPV